MRVVWFIWCGVVAEALATGSLAQLELEGTPAGAAGAHAADGSTPGGGVG